MMKIVASLIIFGLCANLAFAANTGVAPVSSSQGGAFSGLNSSAVKVWNVGNTTDAAIYDSSSTSNNGAGVTYTTVVFGPGATNDTSYVFSVAAGGTTTASATIANAAANSAGSILITSMRKRTLNNTIAGSGSDSTEASVLGDTTVSTSIQIAGGQATAVGPNYLAVLSTGPDTKTAVNNQVFVTLIAASSGSATTITLTTTADVLGASSATPTCTQTSYTLGNIWYDIGAGAFFYTYSKTVNTYSAGSSSTCGTAGASMAYTIYVGGIYANSSNTAFWTKDLAITPVTATHAVSNLVGGNDNWLNSTYVVIAYKDAAATTPTSYWAKTAKSTSTTSGGSPTTLVADSTSGTQGTTTYLTYTYIPVSVWASNYTTGIAVFCQNGTQTTTQYTTSHTLFSYVFSFTNYLNLTQSTTGVADSGLSVTAQSTSAVTSSPLQFWGWQLNTGYTIMATSVGTSTTSYVWGSFYANGTLNGTSSGGSTLGSLTYPLVSLYEDVNGTQWIGWQDIDTANAGTTPPNGDFTYAGYLGKLQGQLNVPTGASILSAISAFFALFLAAIFVF